MDGRKIRTVRFQKKSGSCPSASFTLQNDHNWHPSNFLRFGAVLTPSFWQPHLKIFRFTHTLKSESSPAPTPSNIFRRVTHTLKSESTPCQIWFPKLALHPHPGKFCFGIWFFTHTQNFLRHSHCWSQITLWCYESRWRIPRQNLEVDYYAGKVFCPRLNWSPPEISSWVS